MKRWLFRLLPVGGRRLLAWLAVAGALAIAVAALAPPDRSLLQRAQRLMPLSSRFPHYWWISQREVLSFRNAAAGDWTLVRRDSDTGRQTALDALSALYRRTGARPESLRVSPDGRWVLWRTGRGTAVLAALNGRTHRVVPLAGPGELRWAPTSRHWLELLADGELFSRAVMHGVDEPPARKELPLYPGIPADPAIINVASLTPTEDEHVLAHYWNGRVGRVHPARIVAMGFIASPANSGKYSIACPDEYSEHGALIFCPRAGLIAWVITDSRILPGRPSSSLWVTDILLKKTRRLGGLPGSTRKGTGPLNVQWTPDGENLSFVYDNALWVVSAF